MKNKIFDINITPSDGGVASLKLIGDTHQLDWLSGEKTYGTPYGSFTFMSLEYKDDGSVVVIYQYKDLTLYVSRKLYDFGFVEKYKFVNVSDKDLEFEEGDLGIWTCFNDNYDKAELTLNKKCHMHIWCGLNSTYIAAKRYNGEGNNVGLVVNKGEIASYAVQRSWNSNDRGDVALLLPKIKLKRDEKYELSFVIFQYNDFDDFYTKALTSDNFCLLGCDKYSVKTNEKVRLKIKLGNNDKKIKVHCEDKVFTAVLEEDCFVAELSFATVGEKRVYIDYDKKTTYAEILVFEGQLDVIDRRIDFLIDKQQCKRDGRFNGAFYLYDNEEDVQYVENKAVNDRNFARERAGIVCSLIKRLLIGGMSEEKTAKIKASVDSGMAFIDRAIVSPLGGVFEVPNYRRMMFYDRLYNYSWYILVYSLMYKLTKDTKYLNKAFRITKTYYKKHGKKNYSINLPIYELYTLAVEGGYVSMCEQLKKMFLTHGDYLLGIGTNFPAHEVKYEQSIVAPSVDILLECYRISGDKKYLDEAERQLPLLSAFNGVQPSFHLHEVAIRHWDGFWFGKSKLYGDTFPHYWSCITAAVYSKYAEISSNEEYQIKANKCCDGNLCLFDKEGGGHCVYIYPSIINGKKGKFYDPWANDQDWALYFNLTYNTQITKA